VRGDVLEVLLGDRGLGDLDREPIVVLGAGGAREDQGGRHEDDDQDELVVVRQHLGAGGHSRVPVPHDFLLASSRGEVAPTGGRGLERRLANRTTFG